MVEQEPINVLIVGEPPGAAAVTESCSGALPSWVRRIRRCPTADRGLEALSRERHDVVVLYAANGDRDLDALTALASDPGGAPVIVVGVAAAADGRRDADRACRAGAAEYLPAGEASPGAVLRAVRYAVGAKRMRDALATRDEEFRCVFESVVTGTAQLDRTGRLTRVNARLCELSGYSAAELLHMGLSDLAQPENRARCRRALEGVAAGGEFACVEDGRLVRKDGRIVPVHVVVSAVRNHRGDVDKLAVVLHDLTEVTEGRARLVRTLEAERIRLAEIFAHAPAFICTLRGPDYVFEFANPMYYQFVGHRAIVGRPAREALPEVVNQGYFELLDGVYRTGEPFVGTGMPIVLRREKGAPPEPRDVNFVFQPLRDGEGRVTGILVHGVDVTEQRRAEQALRESEQRLRTLIDHAPACIYYKDLDGRLLDVNRVWAEVAGTSVDRVRGRMDADFFPADAAERFRAADREVAREGRPLVVEEVVPSISGVRTFSSTKFPLVDERGEAYAVCGISTDVTEQRRSERELRESQARLRESEARFRQLADAMPQIVWTTRPDGQQEYVNQRWREYAGTRCEDAAGDGWAATVHPDDRERVSPRWRRSLETGEPYQIEYRLRRADGVYRWHLVRALPIRDAAGRIARWFGTSTDIEDQKTVEQALRDSQERYRLVSLATNDVIWDWDPAADRVFWSDAFESVFGHDRARVSPRSEWWIGHIHPEDRERVVSGVHDAIHGTARAWSDEYRFGRADGTFAVVLDRGFVSRDPAGRAARMIGSMMDVTERKRAEQVARELDALRTALGAHEQVLGVVGHELRTPLAGIRAMSEFLITDGVRERPEFGQFLTSIHAEVVRMANMVNDLLEVARLNSGAARWNWGTVSLAAACADALAAVEPLIDRSRVSLTTAVIPPDLSMCGDADAVRRLVLNLVNNAWKFTPSGSIRVEAAAATVDGTNWVKLTVTDSGAGMSPETVARVGEAFALNSGVVGDNYVQGSGLGLAICKGIVGAHGGHMTVASAVGRGTCFTVMLAADLAGPANPSPAAPVIRRRPA